VAAANQHAARTVAEAEASAAAIRAVRDDLTRRLGEVRQLLTGLPDLSDRDRPAREESAAPSGPPAAGPTPAPSTEAIVTEAVVSQAGTAGGSTAAGPQVAGQQPQGRPQPPVRPTQRQTPPVPGPGPTTGSRPAVQPGTTQPAAPVTTALPAAGAQQPAEESTTR
jgi:hypothetical protein